MDASGARDLHQTEGDCDQDHHRDFCPSDGGRSSESGITRSGDRSRSFYLKRIGRRWRLQEELHDRGAIEPRSRRDRAAIEAEMERNHLPELRKSLLEASDRGSSHDRGRSRRDRGSIVELKAWKMEIFRP